LPNTNNSLPPGTVSKILWHFTGGPNWNATRKIQYSNPKPPEMAFKALRGIVTSKKLLLGRYREVVRVKVSKRVRDSEGKKWIKGPEEIVERESSPVCCVADIPIAHLSYHSGRYGKIAVGFHRQAPLHAGFNPVFYTLHNSAVMKALHRSVEALEKIDRHLLESAAEDVIWRELDDLKCEKGHEVELPSFLESTMAEAFADAIEPVETANERIKSFLAFIKTFDEREFSTIYCEREWRSTADFSFALEDVAMIVLPKTGDAQLFQRFVNEVIPEIKLPRSVPVVPWEDLIEH
jgi:abortive phage resistance protein AbiGi (putative antitoxin)